MSNIMLNDFTDAIITLNMNGVQLNEVHEIIANRQGLEQSTAAGVFIHHSEDGEPQQQQQQQQLLDQQQQETNESATMHNEILNEKLQKICRCCLVENSEMKSIFDENDCIATMIVLLVNLELSPDDGLPGNICLDCLTQLTKCINFKQQIETADITLRHYITEGFQQGMIIEKIDVEQLARGIEEIDENDFDNLEHDTTLPTSMAGTDALSTHDENNIVTSNSNSIQFYTAEENTAEIIDDLQNSSQQPAEEEQLLETFHTDEQDFEEFSAEEEAIIDDNQVNEDTATTTAVALNICETELKSNIKINNDNVNFHEEEHNELISENTSPAIGDDDNGRIYHEKIEYGIDKSPLEQKNCIDSGDDSLRCENLKNFNDEDDEEENFTCDKCNKSYKERKNYIRHVESHSKLHFCEYCKQSFRYRSVFKNHLKCHKNFDEDTENLQSNIDKDNKNCFKCKTCNAVFSLEDDLYVHGSLHDNNNKYICRKCGKEFSAFMKLKRHVPTHFEVKPHKCEICGMGFPELASLTRHFRKHTDVKRDRKFSCELCDKKYYDSHSLMIHKRTHTGEKPWICKICNRSFADLRLLNSHMKIHSTEKTYECEICNKKFTHASTLKTHMRIHTGEKPYVCGVCDKQFIQGSNLNLHMRVHTGERPYKCQLCPMAFASSSTLSSHYQTHTTNKLSYYCPICNKSYSRRHLNIHMRIHLGEKPYECAECLKKFRTSGQLSQHKKVHLNNKNKKYLICEICNENFQNIELLSKHLSLVHNEDDDENNDNKEITAIHKKKRIKITEEQHNEELLTATTTTAEGIATVPNLRSNENLQNNDDNSDSDYTESVLLVNDLLAAVIGTVTNDDGDMTDKQKRTTSSVELSELNCNDENENIDSDIYVFECFKNKK